MQRIQFSRTISTVRPLDEFDIRLLIPPGRDFNPGDAPWMHAGPGIVIGRVRGFAFNARGSDPQLKEPFFRESEVFEDRPMGMTIIVSDVRCPMSDVRCPKLNVWLKRVVGCSASHQASILRRGSLRSDGYGPQRPDTCSLKRSPTRYQSRRMPREIFTPLNPF